MKTIQAVKSVFGATGLLRIESYPLGIIETIAGNDLRVRQAALSLKNKYQMFKRKHFVIQPYTVLKFKLHLSCSVFQQQVANNLSKCSRLDNGVIE